MSIYNSQTSLNNTTTQDITIGNAVIPAKGSFLFWDTISKNLSPTTTYNYNLLANNELVVNELLQSGSLVMFHDGMTLSYDQALSVFTNMKAMMVQSTSMAQLLANTTQNVYVQALNDPNKQQSDALNVTIVGRQGSECLYVSHDWTKPITWYTNSIRVTGETASNPSGDKKTFVLANQNIIDMTDGYVYDEDSLVQDVSHGYSVVVVRDGNTTLNIRECYETSGGDFTVDYVNGIITLLNPAQNAVTVDYSYATDSTWTVKPYPGSYLDIYKAKLQWSTDCHMTDTVDYTVWGLADVFTPQQVTDGYIPSGTLIPIQSTTYKRMGQMVDEAVRLGTLFRVANTGIRGFVNDQISLEYEWDTVRHLSSKAQMELRVTLKHNRPFTGERCTIAFRCISGTEA